MSINHSVISGNLTKDAEVRKEQSGTSVTKFSVANNERQRKNGEWVKVTNFVDVAVFGAYGEAIAGSLAKGTKVVVSGRLRYSAWDSDGKKQSKLEIIADEVEIMSSKETALYADDCPF